MIGLMDNAVLLVEKIAPLNNLDHIPTCNINRCCPQHSNFLSALPNRLVAGSR